MAKFIFTYTEDDYIPTTNREASNIEFTVADDMDINEFKVMCVRMAAALGYHHNSIERAFGDLIFGDEDKDAIKELLDGIIKRDNKTTKR